MIEFMITMIEWRLVMNFDGYTISGEEGEGAK